MKKTIRMREMSNNQEGIIKKVSATGDMGRRIREMGMEIGRASCRERV